jgi:hypothetical protein
MNNIKNDSAKLVMLYKDLIKFSCATGTFTLTEKGVSSLEKAVSRMTIEQCYNALAIINNTPKDAFVLTSRVRLFNVIRKFNLVENNPTFAKNVILHQKGK